MISPTSKQPSVLVVEDYQDSQDCLKALMETQGFTCETANDIREALVKFNLRCADGRECFDGIILDVHLPSASGLGLLRAVRRVRTAIPVFVLTAYGDDIVKFRCKEFQADYDLKPLDDVAGYVQKVSTAARVYHDAKPREVHPALVLDEVIEEMMDRSVA